MLRQEAARARRTFLVAEAGLWLRGTEDVEAARIGVSDPLLLPKRVDSVGFLLERAEAWAMGRVAAAGGALESGARRPVSVENGSGGLVATLVGLSVDAPRLVARVETSTQWIDLEDAGDESLEFAEVDSGPERSPVDLLPNLGPVPFRPSDQAHAQHAPSWTT